MKRVIIIPASEAAVFPGMEVIASAGSIVALVGITTLERSRAAFEDEEVFRLAVARGDADLHSFDDLSAAETFANEKLAALLATEKLFTARMKKPAASAVDRKAPGALSTPRRRKRA